MDTPSKMDTEDTINNDDEGEKEPSNTSQLLPVQNAGGTTRIPEVKETVTDCSAESVDDMKSGHCFSLGCISKIILGVAPTEMCPVMTKLHYVATRLEIYSMLGALLYVLISFSWAEPIRDAVLQLSALFVLAQIFGALVDLIHLPPLLGMLLAGILLRYINFFYATGAFLKFTSTVRACAMTMILLRAGLGLNPSALRRLSTVILRVSTIPCTLEAASVALVSYYVLHFPLQWGFLLGFVLAAVSPAVVVPSLLRMKAEGYGEDKGIPTLVIAASSLDGVFAITMFGVFLSIIFTQGSVTEMIIHGPLEVIIGVTWGVLMGVISIYIPHSGEKSVALLRTIMVGASGLLAVLGSQLVGYAAAGPLGCIVGAFVAACGWRAYSHESTYDPVMNSLNDCWLFLQPFLFGLIGTAINFSVIDCENAGLSIAVMFTGLMVRFFAGCVSALGCGLNLREITFVGLSMLPKATVQAAIGPVALDLVRGVQKTEDRDIELAEQVLTLAVLTILITAPLGAIGIRVAGPVLLNKGNLDKNISKEQSRKEEHVNVELESL